MAIDRAFVLLIGYASDSQRERIQRLVKDHANGWWHHMPDAWIVGGHDHTFWGNTMTPILAGTAGRILVLELPRNKAERMFAQRGRTPEDSLNWLWNTYFGQTPPSQRT